jgi:hypothetical protein
LKSGQSLHNPTEGSAGQRLALSVRVDQVLMASASPDAIRL